MAKLEPEQDDLLSTMVEMHRSVPPQARESFFIAETMGGSWLIHPGSKDQPRTRVADANMLARYGLLEVRYGSSGNPIYDITPEGFEYYEALKAAAGGPTEAMETEVTRYLDSAAFTSRHPDSYGKWKLAADALWSSDSQRSLTSIGHHIREAQQAFATELVVKHEPKRAPADATLTVDRMRSVLRVAKARLGETEAPFLDALLVYWGTTIDLAQRQEHGANRDKDPLEWEDARRLVFGSAVVMLELDRAIHRALPK